MQIEDMITLAEAAPVLGVHVGTLRVWKRCGMLPESRVILGRAVVPRAALPGILDRLRATARRQGRPMKNLREEITV
jgi:predicted site-specific integrase-resolvase